MDNKNEITIQKAWLRRLFQILDGTRKGDKSFSYDYLCGYIESIIEDNDKK